MALLSGTNWEEIHKILLFNWGLNLRRWIFNIVMIYSLFLYRSYYLMMSVIIFFPYRLTISWVDSSQSPASLSVMAFGLMVTYGLDLALNSRYALNSNNFNHQLLVFRCLCQILISEFWLACRWHKLSSSYLPYCKTDTSIIYHPVLACLFSFVSETFESCFCASPNTLSTIVLYSLTNVVCRCFFYLM